MTSKTSSISSCKKIQKLFAPFLVYTLTKVQRLALNFDIAILMRGRSQLFRNCQSYKMMQKNQCTRKFIQCTPLVKDKYV